MVDPTGIELLKPVSLSLFSLSIFHFSCQTGIKNHVCMAQMAQRHFNVCTNPLPKTNTTIPLLGEIACGQPILAEENYSEVVPVPDYVHADFALRCRGDSMVGARILDGDIVYIRQQPDVEDGEIAAVLIGDEATLKRVYKIPGRLQLRPENPSYPVMEYANSDLDQVRILGRAVYFVSGVR